MKATLFFALLPLALATPLSLLERGTCSTPQGSGTCKSTSSCSGTHVAGYCPGPANIQCCVAKAASPPASSGGSGSGGQGIVDAAEAEKGKPYIFGAGNLNGPTSGGFDCSGLTMYAVHKATGKSLQHNAKIQYQDGAGKHIPRAQAQAGDLLFWSTSAGCSGGAGVEHVGIFVRPGTMVNAAKTGTPVREQSIWTSSGGLTICPDAVRFY